MDNITWKTYEHIHTDKTSDWYWIVGIITISLAIISILLNNIIFAILIVVASFTLSLFASRKPNVVNVTLSDAGVAVGTVFYPYEELISYWVEIRDAHPRLIIKSKKAFMPFIGVLLDDVDPDKVGEFLGRHLANEENIEPFFEKLLIYLGF
ncbi:MAG: hypothetical protein WAW92_04700 [Minisyncoccia bacterium]